MGVHDRDYYREDDERGQRLGAPTVLVSLIVLNAAVYLLNFLLTNQTNEIASALSLRPDVFERPWQLYTLVTYGFVHDPDNPLHILFNMYMLYMFGRDVQERFGQRIFLGFYLAALAVSGLAWLAWQLAFDEGKIALGASGAVTATVIAFCTLWPRRQLTFFGLFSFPSWAFAAVVIGLDLLNALSDRSGDDLRRIAWQAHLGGAAFGFLFAWFSPQILPKLRSATGFSPRRWWKSRKLRLHVEAEERAERDFQKLEREADAALARLQEFGEGSLTPRERKALEDYSRHVRQRRS